MGGKAVKGSLHPRTANKILDLLKRAQKMYLAQRYDVAERLSRQVLELMPEAEAARRLLGSSLLWLNRHQEALDFLLPLEPAYAGDASFYGDVGRCYAGLVKEERACSYYSMAIAAAPHLPEYRLLLAGSLRRRGLLEDALEAANVAKLLSSEDKTRLLEALVTIGQVRREMGHTEEALEYLAAAMELNPNSPHACLNAYFCALDLGKMVEMTHLMDMAFITGVRVPRRRFKNIPRWKGQDIAGKRVLIWREQGVGDELFFSALYNWVIERAGEVTIEVTNRMLPLFQRSYPGAKVVAESLKLDDVRSDADFELPAGNISAMFQSSSEALDCFSSQKGWLIADEGKVAHWKRRFQSLGSGPIVGLCWRSLLNNEARSINYFTIEQAAPVLKLPGVTFVNLQYGDCAQDIEWARENLGVTIHNFAEVNLKDDFDEVAAMMRAMDLVFSSATAAAVLSIATGTETWTMHRCGRQPLAPPERLPYDPPHAITWRLHYTEDWGSLLARASAGLADRLGIGH